MDARARDRRSSPCPASRTGARRVNATRAPLLRARMVVGATQTARAIASALTARASTPTALRRAHPAPALPWVPRMRASGAPPTRSSVRRTITTSRLASRSVAIRRTCAATTAGSGRARSTCGSARTRSPETPRSSRAVRRAVGGRKIRASDARKRAGRNQALIAYFDRGLRTPHALNSGGRWTSIAA